MSVDITWALALGATLLISVIPNVLLFFIPNSWIDGDSKSSLNVSKTMLSFASGGLLEFFRGEASAQPPHPI